MQKLTKLRALILCDELWSWIAKTGKWKELWPRWGELTANSHCFACEYHSQNQREKISFCGEICILNKLWGGHCHGKKSPYEKWSNAKTPKTRKKYARIIASFCKREINKIRLKRKG